MIMILTATIMPNNGNDIKAVTMMPYNDDDDDIVTATMMPKKKK